MRSVVGIFGGTFDPVHIGHISLATWSKMFFSFDQLIWVPTGQLCYKAPAHVSIIHRINMLRLVMGENDCLDLTEIVYDYVSLAINTCKRLRSSLPKETVLVYLLGEDSWHDLSNWHLWQELLRYTHIGIFPRNSSEYVDKILPPVWKIQYLHKTYGYSFYLPAAPCADISSTELREKINDRKVDFYKYCSLAIRRYITTNNLYQL